MDPVPILDDSFGSTSSPLTLYGNVRSLLLEFGAVALRVADKTTAASSSANLKIEEDASVYNPKSFLRAFFWHARCVGAAAAAYGRSPAVLTAAVAHVFA